MNDIIYYIKRGVIDIKVAIISDIHGNYIALEEVLKVAKENNVDDYIFLGDLINDLPFGNETLEIVKKTSDKVIKGNKEQYLIEYDKEKYDWKNIQFRNAIFIYNNLSKENLEYIKSLPEFLKLEYDGVKILAVHGSPNSIEELLNQNKRDLLNKYTENLEEDVLVFGHTHDKMWYETINNKIVINAGCCGVSPHYVGQAEFVILEIKNGKVDKIDFKLVSYDLEKVKEMIIKSGILQYEKTLMNLTYLSISGKSEIKYNFLHEAKQTMLEKNGILHESNAKGIYERYFKLYDDDIWLKLTEKYKKYFVF